MKRLRESLCELLQEEFDIVAQAADGREAVEMYRKHEPAAVVMDVVMPHLSGIEATAHILAEYPRAKIVILSGLRDENVVRQALEEGATDYLFKPVEADKLKSLLRELTTNESRNTAQVP